MKKVISVIVSALLALSLFVPMSGSFAPAVSVTAQAATVSKPVANYESATYSVSPNYSGLQVKLTCANKNAQIYYSINGGEYQKYMLFVTIKKNSTLKAYAKVGNSKSAVVTYTYKFKPKLTLKTTNSGSSKKVTISYLTNSGVKIYYTTDGTKPTTKSKKYTSSGIKLTKTTTLKFLAVKSGWTSSYTTKKITVSSSGTGTTSNEYKSAKTGKKFTIPEQGRAQISYDGNVITVPAKFSENTPSKYYNYDADLYVYLDGGDSKTSTKNVSFMMTTTSDKWAKGKSYGLSDLSTDTNHIGVRNIYQYYMTYLKKYSEYVFSHLHQSYYDDAQFTIIDWDKSGGNLKYYFYVKIKDSSSSHTIEGVVNVKKGAETTATNNNPGNNGGNNGGGGSTPIITVPPTQPTKCAVCNGTGVCRPCNGTGKVWGWKQKVTCSTCRGTRKCPYCKNGYIS